MKKFTIFLIMLVGMIFQIAISSIQAQVIRPIRGTATLSLDTTRLPFLDKSNTFRQVTDSTFDNSGGRGVYLMKYTLITDSTDLAIPYWRYDTLRYVGQYYGNEWTTYIGNAGTYSGNYRLVGITDSVGSLYGNNESYTINNAGQVTGDSRSITITDSTGTLGLLSLGASVGSAGEIKGISQYLEVTDSVGALYGNVENYTIESAGAVTGDLSSIEINKAGEINVIKTVVNVTDTVGQITGISNMATIESGNMVVGYYGGSYIGGYGGTVDSLYQIYLTTPFVQGHIMKNYGIYIADQAVADSASYSIYSAGGNVVLDEATFAGGSGSVASGLYAFAWGYRNTASGQYSVVSGGAGNTANGDGSVVSGGGGNTASGEGSVVSGGGGNTATGYASVVLGGENALADKANQTVTNSHGFDGGPGTAQSAVMQVSDTVNHVVNAWHDLYTNGMDGDEQGADSLITIAANSAWTFEIRVIGNTASSAKVWSYTITGAIKRDGSGNTTLLGSTVSVVYESDADFDCQVVADDTNEALHVQVKDATYGGDVVRWVATIQTTEVIFAGGE